MDFILQPANENLDYHHKKFDQRKRSREMITPTLVETENHYERVGTPYSISSESTYSSSTALGYAVNTSTPNAKRRKLLPNQHNDSGISLTSEHRIHDKNEDEISIASSLELPCLTPQPHFRTTDFSDTSTSISTPPPSLPPPSLPPPITPTAAILPKMSNETLRSICKYHGNMVRKFPKKERTPKDQERRNKNTLACRMSRRVKKLEHVAIEEQYKEFLQEQSEITEATLRAAAYLNKLMKLAAVSSETNDSDSDVIEVVEVVDEQPSSSSAAVLSETNDSDSDIIEVVEVVDEQPSSSSRLAIEQQLTRKRSFSIAFLAGIDQN